MESKAVSLARSMMRRPGTTIAVSLAGVALLYFAILTRGSFSLAHKTPSGFAFNSMLLHLLRGTFDVDPETIANEGFLVNGKVYSYFGIMPALFRLIFLPFVDFGRTNLTTISCLVANLIAVGAQLAILIRLFRQFGHGGREWLLLALMAVTLFAGPQIYLLRPSIYQEPVYWALAFASLFLYGAIEILLFGRAATIGLLSLMALLAGLTLLTRVSVALALYGAMAVVLLNALVPPEGERFRVLRAIGTVFTPRTLLPGLLLLMFAAMAGYVNYQRFGNPLTFIDLRYQLMSTIEHPDRLTRLATYGAFNITRLWFGLMYYFLPLWAIRGPDGQLAFSEFHHRYFDMVELPPSSFFLSDPLLMAFAAVGAWKIVTMMRHDFRRAAPLAAVALALALPPVLELCAIALAFRYRGDFYPLFLFLAATGVSFLLSLPQEAYRRALLPRLAWPFALLGMMSCVVLLGLNWLSPYGDGTECVTQGFVACFENRIPGHSGAAEHAGAD